MKKVMLSLTLALCALIGTEAVSHANPTTGTLREQGVNPVRTVETTWGDPNWVDYYAGLSAGQNSFNQMLATTPAEDEDVPFFNGYEKEAMEYGEILMAEQLEADPSKPPKNIYAYCCAKGTCWCYPW